MHTLSYHFLQTYVMLSLIDMNDFSLHDLPTFDLQPYVSIMLNIQYSKNWWETNLEKKIYDFFDSFQTLQWNLGHILEAYVTL